MAAVSGKITASATATVKHAGSLTVTSAPVQGSATAVSVKRGTLAAASPRFSVESTGTRVNAGEGTLEAICGPLEVSSSATCVASDYVPPSIEVYQEEMLVQIVTHSVAESPVVQSPISDFIITVPRKRASLQLGEIPVIITVPTKE